jgi:hypothetical protein
MRRLIALIALPALLVALFVGCTKEREIVSGPGGDTGKTCIGCHSDQAALQDLTSAGKWAPPASGREDG